MANDQNKTQNDEFSTNKGTRMDSAAEGQTQDQQAEGGKNKGMGDSNKPGSRQEGQYDKQSDDPTMRPSSADEPESNI